MWINRLDSTQNLPLWFGPWAGGLVIDGTQDTGGLNTSSLAWEDHSSMVQATF